MDFHAIFNTSLPTKNWTPSSVIIIVIDCTKPRFTSQSEPVPIIIKPLGEFIMIKSGELWMDVAVNFR
jgi:hypothetical protein